MSVCMVSEFPTTDGGGKREVYYQPLCLAMNARLRRADSKADAASRFTALSLGTVGVQSAHSFDLETCKRVASHSKHVIAETTLTLSLFSSLPVSLSAHWKLNLASRQQSIWGRPLPKWAKGTLLSLLVFFSSRTLLIATHLWHLSVRLSVRATFSPIKEASVGARGPCSASVTHLGPLLLR